MLAIKKGKNCQNCSCFTTGYGLVLFSNGVVVNYAVLLSLSAILALWTTHFNNKVSCFAHTLSIFVSDWEKILYSNCSQNCYYKERSINHLWKLAILFKDIFLIIRKNISIENPTIIAILKNMCSDKPEFD